VFESFFPKPKVFFPSVLIWAGLGILVWYGAGDTLGAAVGFALPEPEGEPIVGLSYFYTQSFLWFYVYYTVWSLAFAGFWFFYSPHKWQLWSILGSVFILFTTYFGVQVSVALNNWRRPFFDQFQQALTGDGSVSQADLYGLILIFVQIAFISTAVFVVTRFFVSHYVFRWRTAMNNFYMERWPRVRNIEGASQRVQEDTMRFASIMEGLGVSFVRLDHDPDRVSASAGTHSLNTSPKCRSSARLTDLWFMCRCCGRPLARCCLPWSASSCQVSNSTTRSVEAAYRKELVYGEDHAAERAAPPTCDASCLPRSGATITGSISTIIYFGIARWSYLQADNIYVHILLVPTIVTGRITLGIWQQILTAFGQVSNSFQFLINSWTTIVELISIYKRLHAFEAVFRGQELAEIERNYLAREGGGFVQPVPNPSPGEGGPDAVQTLEDPKRP
jgi:peptide/bleomycin uptake transporter